MLIPQSSMRAFLSTARKSLASAVASGKPVNFVIGNESADLDSITSSLVYAYLRSTQSTSHDSVYVPLLNIPASDIRIRPELLALLPHANIETSHLITLDDLPPSSQLKPELTRWILVDHNALQGPLGATYSSRVSGCIDHHVDEKTFSEDKEDPRLITKSGSCQSLVVNHFRDAWERLSNSASASNTFGGQSDAIYGTDDNAVRRTWDMQIAKLALASILIDTHNLESQDKVTDHDRKAVNYLESKIYIAPRGGGQFDRATFFQQINSAKQSLDGLTLPELLRKDYKQWTEKGMNLGISSVVKPLKYLERNAAGGARFFDELDTFAKERDLALLGIMTTSTSETGEFQRELLLRAVHPKCAGIVNAFHASCEKELKLNAISDIGISEAHGGGTRIWWQKDLSKSRKQVAPLLRKAMNA